MNLLHMTTTSIKALQPDTSRQYVVWDDRVTGLGLRVSPGGTKTFFYQGRVLGKTTKITIGKFGIVTLKQAQERALEWAADMLKGIDPSAKAKAAKRARAQGGSLGDLLMAYCDDLEAAGKLSAKAVRVSLQKNVQRAFPAYWRKPCNQIDLDDCMAIISRLVQAGKKREADKVRSYLRAAYSAAINARQDASASQHLRDFKLSANPARELRKVKGSSGTSERVLSLPELQAYWQEIGKLPEPYRSALRFHLLTGGQRIVQLKRVTMADISRHETTMTLLDPKGRREEPRRHVVPLLSEALDAIDAMGSGPYVFTLSGGKRPISERALNDAVKGVCAKMEDAGTLEGEPFTPKVIRSTVETRLAAMKVSSDVLAHLLSHGMGGVQMKHYQRHDFEAEKRDALALLWSLLHPGSKVVRIKEGIQ